MRSRIFTFLSLVAALAAGTLSAQAAKPNIIFILVDDMGWGDLGVFYQNSREFATNRDKPAFVTPHLDTMAAEGMQLRRHYSPAPVCAPSRASLLLGVHQGHSNVRNNSFDKALEDNHTLGTVMKQAGYATAVIGKWGLQGSGLPAPARPQLRGFDYFFGYLEHGDAHKHYPKENGANVYDDITDVSADLDKCYSTDFIAARAKKWIVDQNTADASQPFFLYLTFTAPHARLDVPTQSYPAGNGVTGGLQWIGTPGNMINTANGTINSWIHPDYASATYDDDNNSGTAEVAWPDYAKRHATMIRRIDNAVSDLVQTLKDLNRDDDTLIVFTSDNGPHNEAGSGGSYKYDPRFFGSFGPMDGIKRDTWEGGMREPCIVRWPSQITAGGISTHASQFHDWMPTFAEVAGVPAPARSDGTSLVPTLTGTGSQEESTIYVEYYYSGSTPNYTEFEASHRNATRNQEQVIHLESYKGIRYNVGSASDDFRIYETLNDVKETTNLAGTNSYFIDLQQRMKDRVLQVRRVGGGVSRPYDSEPVPSIAVTTIPGLQWMAYEDTFPWVPDFGPLTAAASGDCSGLDLSVRTRDNDIGLLYSGYLDVPTDGTYTFYLNTDSKAFLRIHDAILIDADFGYTGGSEVSSSIPLKAGKHPIRLGYVRGTGGTPALTLQWSSSTISKQAIPTTSLVKEGIPEPGPPSANPDSATTQQNTPVIIDVLANDSDDGTPAPIEIESVGTPSAGSAVVNASDMIVYTPNNGFLGEDSFTYTITDGQDSSTATVSVDVIFVGGQKWFPFDQDSGLITNEAGGAAIGQLSGFNNDPAQWVDGHSSQALDFGGGQHVTVSGYNGILGTNARTCAAWVKTTGTGQMPVIAWGPNAAGQKWTFIIQNGHARIEVTSGFLEGSTSINNGQWHHVAVTFENDGSPNVTDAKLYVDGVLETSFAASGSRTTNTTSTGDVKIGSDIQSRFFIGMIDEAQIHDRALSATEITALTTRNATEDAWYYRHTGDPTPTSNDWLLDTDSDGFNARLEFALGGNPTVSSTRIAPTLTESLDFVFNRRREGISASSYIPQISETLGSWSQFGTPSVDTHPTLEGFDRVTVSLPPTTEPARFVRLRLDP